MVVEIVYFVHGTTDDNAKGISTGQVDVRLSELGKRQMIELKDEISVKDFDVVFCSDLKRASDAAKLTFGGVVKIVIDKRLREIDYGKMSQKPKKEVDVERPQRIEKSFPGGESYKDVGKRIASFLADLKKNYSGKCTAIVAHQAPQIALDVLLKGKTWEQALKEDWRLKKAWQPGWKYTLN